MSAIPTIYDVARAADVSTTTVSRVLNGTGYVSATRRERIEAVIVSLGYLPNTFARLRSQRVTTVNVVVDDLAEEFVARVTNSVITEAALSDILVFVSAQGGGPAARHSPGVARTQSRGGTIYVAGRNSSPRTFAHRGAAVPTVLVAETETSGGDGAVLVDSRAAAHLLGRRAASIGHKRVAIVGSSDARWSLAERVLGLREGAIEGGAPPETITVLPTLPSESGGEAAAQHLFGQDQRTHPPGPTAVLCVDDSIAIGVMKRCRALGLNLPEDVSVTGFGDTRASRSTTPRLMTAHLPAEEVGRAALQLLVNVVGDPDAYTTLRMFPATVIDGDSLRSITMPLARA